MAGADEDHARSLSSDDLGATRLPIPRGQVVDGVDHPAEFRLLGLDLVTHGAALVAPDQDINHPVESGREEQCLAIGFRCV
jgi:hypothetical protein